MIEQKLGVKARPILKWAGGKKWLTREIENFLPQKYNNYHEPFLGSGAIFLFLNPPNQAFLSDLNDELINVYRQVKNKPSEILTQLKKFKNTSEYFYQLRKNPNDDLIFKAARLIFLNKTCFNGLYRVNSKGEFNVPYGQNEGVNIFEEENIVAVSKALKKAKLSSKDFSNCLDKIEKNDFVFLDPPYTVAHNNNGFIEYNKKVFSWEDQERLAEFISGVINKKAFYVLTNAVHPSIIGLYDKYGKRFELERHSCIAGQVGNRKKTSEYIFTNCI